MRFVSAGSERLPLLAGLEAHRFAARDADFLAGARMPAAAGLAGADVEHAKAAQRDSLALAKRALHSFEDSLDGLLRLGPAHTSLAHHRIHDIELDHTSPPLSSGKLC